jgi:hypothetical protein
MSDAMPQVTVDERKKAQAATRRPLPQSAGMATEASSSTNSPGH